jgi:DNA polymerase-3 subunit delta'
VERLGERGSGRRALEERHRRELRRHRTDELQSGLVALAGAYRDRLAAGTVHEPGAAIEAVTAVHEAIEAMERNPNEVLLLQALLLRLPSL